MGSTYIKKCPIWCWVFFHSTSIQPYRGHRYQSLTKIFRDTLWSLFAISMHRSCHSHGFLNFPFSPASPISSYLVSLSSSWMLPLSAPRHHPTTPSNIILIQPHPTTTSSFTSTLLQPHPPSTSSSSSSSVSVDDGSFRGGLGEWDISRERRGGRIRRSAFRLG